jgi:HTH-type transcriptional regulator / antitoxin MqsA
MARECPNCECHHRMTPFESEAFAIEHAGMTTIVEGLSGWRCQDCGEVEFDVDSARRYAEAGDELVLRDRKRVAGEIRRVRRKLGLSQTAAARLTGGGHNAPLPVRARRGGAATGDRQPLSSPGQTSGATERIGMTKWTSRGQK